MVKRTARKKTKKNPTHKKKKSFKIKTMTALENIKANQKAHWRAYYELRDQIENAWSQLKNDVKNGTSEEVLADQQRLLILMGECNYMLQECVRLRNKRRNG